MSSIPSKQDLLREAKYFRQKLDDCDKESTEFVTEDFPIMNCRLSSLLLAYHFHQVWPSIVIQGFSGVADKHHEISHFWLEVGDIAIDITGDQYNLIEDMELNSKIIKRRPFPRVHVEKIEESYLYEVFELVEEFEMVKGFPDFGDDSIDSITRGYNQLVCC